MKYISIIALAAVIATSCAKAEPEDTVELEKQSFKAWMAKYRSQAVEQPSGGIYVEVLEDGDQTIDSGRDTTVWIMLDYTATDIHGNVFVTRDSMEALRQRTFTPATHYIPDLLWVGDENYGMIEGQYFALRNDLKKSDGSTIKMSAGTRVRLYIPSYLAYGSYGFSDDQGYGGQFELGTTKIVIEDLIVKEVFADPIEREEKLVTERATIDWGLAEADTLARFLYVDSLSDFAQRAGLLDQYPNKPWDKETQLLTADSTARIRFVGRFLDGFIFDTNIQSVYDGFYNRRIGQDYLPDEKTLSALSFKASDDEEKYIPAFAKTIPKLRRQQWYRLVFTSAYGYGGTGLSAALQEQQEYQNAYLSYMYNSMYYNNMMSNGGYGGYYDNYYGYGDYYGYSSSGYSTEEDEQEIITEIQPYTPLIFDIYIETEE